jgi:dTDP-4-amino-4,6-dideoxygalactose transaminase
LIKFLGEKFIHAVFHYQSLHRSPFHETQHDGRILSHADRFSDCLVRLPLYYEISDDQITRVVESVRAFYRL